MSRIGKLPIKIPKMVLVNVEKGFVYVKGPYGYRCQITENQVNLNLGFNHPIILAIPSGIDVHVEANTNIKILGTDKEKVGFFASKIRDFRPPEPYNGKGVLYKSEVIVRKAGKAGKK